MTTRLRGAVLVVVVLGADPAAAQDARTRHPAAEDRAGPTLRQELEALEAHLDRAVARVSVPHVGILMGRTDETRGYRLPGYGVVFVLAPRALPGGHDVYVMRRAPGPGGPILVGRRVPPPGDERAWAPEHVEEIERQVLILQHVAEAERRAAEENMERIVRDVRIRLSPPHPAPPPGDEEVPPAEDRTPPPAPPGDFELPATPPWKFWFEAGPSGEERSPERVVAEVKAAVIEAVEARTVRVDGLEADEFIAVAVDFVSGGLFASHPRPARTLVVRVRQRDLDARARGSIGSDELHRRVEVIEY